MTDEILTETETETELAPETLEAPEPVELADPFGALLEAIEKAEKPETLDKLIEGLNPELAYDETANLTDDQRLELRLKAERKRFHMLPLPNYRIDGVPEGAALVVRGPNGELRSAERHDEVYLTPEQLKDLLADGYKIAMLPHIPHEHLPPSVLIGTGEGTPDYSELPVPEDAHPEIKARLESENANRRALKALDEEHARISAELVQREKEERERWEAEQAAKREEAAKRAAAAAPAEAPAEPAPATESSSSKKKKSG